MSYTTKSECLGRPRRSCCRRLLYPPETLSPARSAVSNARRLAPSSRRPGLDAGAHLLPRDSSSLRLCGRKQARSASTDTRQRAECAI